MADNIQKDMEQVAQKWAEHIVGRFRKQIEKKKIVLTQELLDSFDYKVYELGDGNVGVNISYVAHGKFIDMKKLYYSKMPSVDALEAWVLKKGLDKFDSVPGYPNGWKRTGEDQAAARRIAWGIAVSIGQKKSVDQYDKWQKSKQWRVPELRKGITYLNRLLAEELARVAQDRIITAFQS
jgi:hypothetical protein